MVLICLLPVYVKPNGSTPEWIVDTKKARERLGMEASAEPWTDRPVQLRGCSTQTSQPFFLFELLNIRWFRYCKRQSLDNPEVVAPPRSLLTDTRQCNARQGNTTLLANSRMYWHAAGRCNAPFQHLLHLGYIVEGWPDDSAKRSHAKTVAKPKPSEPKRRKLAKRRGDPNLQVCDLSGNGMELPNLVR